MLVNSKQGMGDLLPCCDSSVSFFDAVFSDSCDYCSSGQVAANQGLLANTNNSGNTSGVPCCDPNNGIIANLFSNSCNVCNPIGDAIGLPNVPEWVWVTGIGIIGFILLREGR